MMKKAALKDFDYYIDEFMYNCQSRCLRPKTMNSYEQTLRLFERWCLDNEAISLPEKVTDSVIRRYVSCLQERGKYTFYFNTDNINYCPERRRDYSHTVSITTINNYLRNLRVFFNWFSEFSLTPNPMDNVKLLKNERKAMEYLEDEEINKLLKIFDKSYFSEHRDYLITILILDTGMRLGECLMLTVDDIDINERTIYLPAENTKGRRNRCVFFSVKTSRLLQRWLRFKDRYSGGKLIFPTKSGTKLELHTFDTNFKRYLARAGIDKPFSPHGLRNNFSKRCLMNGMDIYTLSRILGHSSVTVTEAAYLDLTDQDLRRRYQNFSPIENIYK